jgi:hypothetical protein
MNEYGTVHIPGFSASYEYILSQSYTRTLQYQVKNIKKVPEGTRV